MMHIKNLVTTVPIPNSDGWHTAVLTVDPETARQMLSAQEGHHNRKTRPGAVARYAATMRSGSWVTSPEPLVFSPSGRLLNGQHRLNAVVKTGMPQTFLFMFGVDEQVFQVLDRGAPRSLADALDLPKKLAEAARFFAYLRSTGGDKTVIDSDVAKMADIFSDAHAAVQAACNTHRTPFAIAGFRAAATLRIFGGADAEKVGATYRALVLQDWDNAPLVARAMIRAHTKGGLLTSSEGQQRAVVAFARGWAVFDPANSDCTRMPPLNVEAARAEARSALQKAVDDANV
jgi:hypothetical protein